MPAPVTGRFTTRKQLETFVRSKASLKRPWSRTAIASDAQVAPAIVGRILSKRA